MTRLIDADALIKKWENVHSKDMSFEMAIIGATNDVKKAPTVDAVPVIRCKDCPHSMSFTEQAKKWTRICTHFNMSVPNDWFCAIPVREREGAEHDTVD